MQHIKAIRNASPRTWKACAIGVLASVLLVSPPVQAQDTSNQAIQGTVTTVTATTLLIRTDDTTFKLYAIDRNTTRPTIIPVGAIVDVASVATGDPTVRLATVVTIVRNADGSVPKVQNNVPASVKNAERSLAREARSIRFGFQGGFTLDPETVAIGVHAKFGPIFSENLLFRPSFEYDYGEVTKVYGINADLLYNIPIGASRNSFYFGVGPAFNFTQQGFDKSNFSEFHFDSALNILAGYQFRSGLFTEVRTSVYASPAPVFHLTVGYTF
jgi:hypothetical protein